MSAPGHKVDKGFRQQNVRSWGAKRTSGQTAQRSWFMNPSGHGCVEQFRQALLSEYKLARFPRQSIGRHSGICSFLAQFQTDGEGTLFRLDLIISREARRIPS
jgi:hypothetical protein